MMRLPRRLSTVGLLTTILALSTPTPSSAFNFGVQETVIVEPAETVFVPSVLPTTRVVTTSRAVLAPTTTVLRPTTTVLRPTSVLVPTSVVRVRRDNIFTRTGRFIRETLSPTPTTRIVRSELVPTSVVYESSLAPTVYWPTTTSFVSSPLPTTTTYILSDPIVETVIEDRPVSSGSRPARRDSSAIRTESEPPLRTPNNATPEPEIPEFESFDGQSPPGLLGPPPASIDDLPPANGETRESFRPRFADSSSANRAIRGRVIDNGTREPEAGLTVRFLSASSAFDPRETVTNADGSFTFDEFLPDGDWTVEVFGPGEDDPVQTYSRITINQGRLYDREGRSYGQLVLRY